jgi:plastocyanin
MKVSWLAKGLLIAVLVFSGIRLKESLNSQSNPLREESGRKILTEEVKISDNSFNPQDLTVEKGTRVVWHNTDEEVHRLISPVFGTGDIEDGQRWSYLFENPGEFSYSCLIHPQMKGKVTVK